MLLREFGDTLRVGVAEYQRLFDHSVDTAGLQADGGQGGPSIKPITLTASGLLVSSIPSSESKRSEGIEACTCREAVEEFLVGLGRRRRSESSLRLGSIPEQADGHYTKPMMPMRRGPCSCNAHRRTKVRRASSGLHEDNVRNHVESVPPNQGQSSTS